MHPDDTVLHPDIEIPMTTLLQPQPIGIFTGATAHLLLPPLAADCHAEEQAGLEQVLRGDLSASLPAPWQFFVAAAQGDLGHAKQLLAATGNTADPLHCELLRYNQFVLEPSPERFHSTRAAVHCPQISALLTAVGYAYGIVNELPVIESLSGELRAWALATIAADKIQQEHYAAARQALAEAIAATRGSSPLLCAIMLSQSAQVAAQSQLPLGIVQDEIEQAIEFAKTSSLSGLLAELYTQLGMTLQHAAGDNRHAMQAAVRAYQMALQSGITRESSPITFAELQNNLGLAYLGMPHTESSNQLRMGIAIQSFRKALESVSPEQHSDLWSRINMNLANALQYAPSSHPAENLIQAVELYDQVLQVRTRARDPVAYALVILNQANALAHLGIFKPALEKASEAYKLFQWYDQTDEATTARELVENVNSQIERDKETDRDGVTATENSDSTDKPELQHGSV